MNAVKVDHRLTSLKEILHEYHELLFLLASFDSAHLHIEMCIYSEGNALNLRVMVLRKPPGRCYTVVAYCKCWAPPQLAVCHVVRFSNHNVFQKVALMPSTVFGITVSRLLSKSDFYALLCVSKHVNLIIIN